MDDDEVLKLVEHVISKVFCAGQSYPSQLHKNYYDLVQQLCIKHRKVMIESINTIFKGRHTFQPVVFGNLVGTFSIILNSFHITQNKTDLNL